MNENVVARLKENNFDLLRLVLASMVLFFHIGILSQVPALQWMTKYVSATFAVQAFFVVSGFLVTMSYENSRDLKTYAIKRLKRIAPAYILVVLGAAVLLSLVSTLGFNEYFTSRDFWRYIGFNLILSNFSAPSLPGVFESNHEVAVNASLWTIKIEVAFYAFVPILVLLVRKFGRNFSLGTVGLLSVVWIIAFNSLSVNEADIFAKLGKQLPGQLAFFVGGAWAYYRTREGEAVLPVWLALPSIAIYALSRGPLFHAVAPVCVLILVYVCAISIKRFVDVGKYGDFSYGIYIYHFPVVQYLVAVGVVSNAHPELSLVAVLIAYGIAVASWYFVEKPWLKHRQLPVLISASA